MEVESQMAAMQVSGAPVSVLMDYGISEKLLEKLLEGGVATVEQLGAMTPEQIQAIPGITTKQVEKIQFAVNGYYGGYDPAAVAAVSAEGDMGELVEEPVAEEALAVETADAAADAGESVENGSADAGEGDGQEPASEPKAEE